MLSQARGMPVRPLVVGRPQNAPRRPGTGSSTQRRRSRDAKAPPVSGASGRGGVTMFEVPFASSMTDGDLALLARVSDLSMRMHPKLSPRHESPGLGRLDHSSGLFLNRGEIEGEWTLEGRTWGHPDALSVHEWHVLAAGAAHRLDPTVSLPERLQSAGREIPDRPLGHAANKRLAGLRRRLVGLP
jgi:hypothetical protein